jgi:hypothetical protein
MEEGESRDTASCDQTSSAWLPHQSVHHKKYHIPDSNCVCELCGGQCGRYHLQMCAKRVKTLCEYAKDKM